MSLPMTKEGLAKLEAELAELEERRPKILLSIKEAREKGDLKENAEYHAAREDLGLCEGRISDLRSKISQATVIDPAKMAGDTIVFGAKVKLYSIDFKEEEEFHLVGEGEADPFQNKILTSSPMGQALLTKKVGDTIQVPAPKGLLKYKVLAIKYG